MDQSALIIVGFLGTGFVLGLRHALDPDHVMAVTAIISRTGSLKSASVIGAFWGAGHASMLLVAGMVILVLKIAVPPQVAAVLEGLVAAALVILGISTIIGARKDDVHLHVHEHDGGEHIHFHGHAASSWHDHAHIPFVVGMVHGLAGSAGLALLAMSAASSVSSGLIFMAIFALGSILGMLLTSTAISAPVLFAARHVKISRVLPSVAGAASIVFGLAMLAQIAFNPVVLSIIHA